MEESLTYLKEQFELPDVDVKSYSPLVLAYIGDGIYELVIRTAVVGQGNRQANALHKKTSTYVKAVSMAKHATMHDYRHATGFEALMGYLYLNHQMKRLIDLVKLGMERTEGMP